LTGAPRPRDTLLLVLVVNIPFLEN